MLAEEVVIHLEKNRIAITTVSCCRVGVTVSNRVINTVYFIHIFTRTAPSLGGRIQTSKY